MKLNCKLHDEKAKVFEFSPSFRQILCHTICICTFHLNIVKEVLVYNGRQFCS